MKHLCLASVALSLSLVSAAGAQTVLLRYRPPVGKTATYNFTMTMTQSVPGMAQPMTFSQSVPMTLRVVSRNGPLTTLQTKTGQAKVAIPATNPMSGMKASMEKMMSNMTSSMVMNEFGTPQGGGVKGSAAGSMGNMFQGMQGITYPKGPVKVGDTWTSTIDPGKMMGQAVKGMAAAGKINVVYRLTALRGKSAIVGMTMKGATNMSFGGRSMKMIMDSSGNMDIDSATGFLNNMHMTSNTTMNMGQGVSPMHQRMSMAMTTR